MIKATNNFVWVIRDEAEKEMSGLSIPGIGQEKPGQGTIFSSGKLVKDENIKGGKGKKCLFHPGSGFSIPFEGSEYLILEDAHIIGII
jgi:co-chaperonin GroES (HSP10)